MFLKRRIVPTGEPCNTETVPHGSVGGRGKRRVSDLARGLPNLLRRSRFRQQVSASVREHRSDYSEDSPPYTFFLLNGDMELYRNW